MEIILLESINKLGKAGQIVNVKDGFANNYLIREKKAIIANKKNKADLESRISYINTNNEIKIKEAKKIKDVLNGKNISLEMEANDDGMLYGAVTQKSICVCILNLFKIDISAETIIIDPIKVLGKSEISINLYDEIIAQINLEIIKKN